MLPINSVFEKFIEYNCVSLQKIFVKVDKKSQTSVNVVLTLIYSGLSSKILKYLWLQQFCISMSLALNCRNIRYISQYYKISAECGYQVLVIKICNGDGIFYIWTNSTPNMSAHHSKLLL